MELEFNSFVCVPCIFINMFYDFINTTSSLIYISVILSTYLAQLVYLFLAKMGNHFLVLFEKILAQMGYRLAQIASARPKHWG